MQKKNLETILYSAGGVIVMAIILTAFYVITSAFHRRVDLTREKAFTLSDGTRAILAKLDTPVKIRFYFTQGESANDYMVPIKAYAKKVEDLLTEFRQAAKGKIVVEKYDPQPDSDAEDSARLDGIDEQSLPAGDRLMLGLSVSVLDTKEAIPFLSPDRERQLEYDIARAISRVINPERPVVGIMSSLPVFGAPANPMMMQMGQQQGQQPWTLVNELRNDFTVKRVEMDADKIDDDIKVLMVIHPSEISDRAQFAIDQFVLRGGKLIAFLDAQSLVDNRGQNQMGMSMGGGSSLDKLLKAWGLQFDTSKVVADRTFKMVLGEEGDMTRQRPAWLMLTPDGINENDIVTAELDNVWYFAGGVFTGTPAQGLTQSVLLKTSKDSQLVEGMMANFGGEGILKDFKPSGVSYALAVRLSGKFKTAFPDGNPDVKKDEEKKADDKEGADKKPEDKAAEKKPDGSLKESQGENTVLLIGDADMIYDGYTLRRMNTPFGVLAMPMNGNLNFAQNAVEQLAGDQNLIGARSRAALNRPFTRIRAIEAAAEQKFMAKIKELEDVVQQANSRLMELEQQKAPNQRFIRSPELQAERDNVERKKVETERELRKVRKDFRRDVVALQRKVQWTNILAMPIVVSLTGIVLAVYKRKRTSAR